MIAWQNKETGEWVRVDRRESHTRMKQTYVYTTDINSAYTGTDIPQRLRDECKVVEVVVVRTVTIKEQENEKVG